MLDAKSFIAAISTMNFGVAVESLREPNRAAAHRRHKRRRRVYSAASIGGAVIDGSGTRTTIVGRPHRTVSITQRPSSRRSSSHEAGLPARMKDLGARQADTRHSRPAAALTRWTARDGVRRRSRRTWEEGARVERMRPSGRR